MQRYRSHERFRFEAQPFDLIGRQHCFRFVARARSCKACCINGCPAAIYPSRSPILASLPITESGQTDSHESRRQPEQVGEHHDGDMNGLAVVNEGAATLKVSETLFRVTALDTNTRLLG